MIHFYSDKLGIKRKDQTAEWATVPMGDHEDLLIFSDGTVISMTSAKNQHFFNFNLIRMGESYISLFIQENYSEFFMGDNIKWYAPARQQTLVCNGSY